MTPYAQTAIKVGSVPKTFGTHRVRFLQRYPNAEALEQALRSAQNRDPLFFFLESRDPDVRDSWYVLGRLGPEHEERFSIAGEILFMFTPFGDLQRRTYNLLTSRARDELSRHQREVFGEVRFTPDSRLSLLWAPDPMMSTKLKAWNAEGSRRLVAPIPDLGDGGDGALSSLLASIGSVIASRDLYQGKNPVTGSDFFGREQTLNQLSAELRSGRSLGLFGLRRSGKTSILRELQRRGESSEMAVIITDLEAVENLNEMPDQMSASLLDSLRRMKASDPSIWIGAVEDHKASTYGGLSSRLTRIAEKNPHLHFTVAVDEIESLRAFVKKDAEGVRTFLGSLRRASQAVPNLSLLFTGVTMEFFQRSMLNEEVDNPLFGFVDSHFLRPFTSAETAHLVSDLGARMLLKWEDEALELVHTATGGFPFFVRDLASRVRGDLQGSLEQGVDSVSERLVTFHDVAASRSKWGPGAAQLWVEIRKTLAHYHELMAAMLSSTSDEELSTWLDLGEEAEAAAQALVRLGFLSMQGDGAYKISPEFLALSEMGGQGGAGESISERISATERVQALLRSPESQQLEFKSTSRVNIHTQKVDKAIEHAIAKTVAGFLNADGGTLLVGVDDTGGVCGLVRDLQTFRNGSLDEFERWLRGSLLGETIGNDIVASHVDVSFQEVSGCTIALVQVTGSSVPAWLKWNQTDQFYVRNGNETRELLGRELVSYLSRR